MFKNVMMVCIGNICRSPMAEIMLREAKPELTVFSSGLGALVDKPADPNTVSVLNTHDIDNTSHAAQQINADLVKKADIILTMENRHIKSIHTQFPESRGKVHLIGKWQDNTEIPDPYKKDIKVFEETYTLVQKGLESWQNKLWK